MTVPVPTGVRLGFVVPSARAQAAGVLLTPLSRYTITSPRRGWLFGYAGYDTAALRAAAENPEQLLHNS